MREKMKGTFDDCEERVHMSEPGFAELDDYRILKLAMAAGLNL